MLVDVWLTRKQYDEVWGTPGIEVKEVEETSKKRVHVLLDVAPEAVVYFNSLNIEGMTLPRP